MNDADGDGDNHDDDATDGAADAAADDDRNYNNSDIACNNMNCDEVEGEGVEEEDDKMGDGTNNSEVVSRKQKR